MWWIVAALILLGIILVFVETLLLPGLGIAGVLSLVSLGASCWYSFAYLGATAGRWVTAGVCVLVLIILFVLLRAKTWKRLGLDTAIESKVDERADSLEPGAKGVAMTRLAPMGTAEFDGLSWEVKSHDNKMVDAGSHVEVVRIEDNKILVKTINE